MPGLGCRQAVLLADSSKSGSDHFARFADLADLADLAAIVTDSALPEDAASDLETAGPQVVRS